MELIANRKTAKYIRAIAFISLIAAMGLAVLISLAIIVAKVAGPPPVTVPQTTVFYGNDDSVIGESKTGEQRHWVPLDQISPFLREATIAIEDQRFYEHHGFDFRRIAGAALADIKAGAKVQGASTITQQYARNLYLSHDKTWK